MDIIHNSVDVPIQFNSLLFIPKFNFDFFGISKTDYGLDLFVRKILIQHKNKKLLPEHLSFVKGVVDSEDLPLNISRETLQENAIFTKISNTVTKNVYSYLLDKAKSEPEKYDEFWKVHGKIFKLGYGDYSNHEKYSLLLRFNSSAEQDSKSLISLETYISRMKEGQKNIYYLYGESKDAINMDPHIELFKKKGIEVLYFYEPLDEFIVSTLRKFKNFDFKAVDSSDPSSLENIKDDEDKIDNKFEELSKDDELNFSSLLSKMKDILGDRVIEVKESKRLTDSAACLVNPDDNITTSMKKILRLANKEMGVDKKIFEINKNHKLIRNMLKMFKNNPNDEFILTAVEQLFESTLLQEGSLLDPHKLVNRINKMLEDSSDWYSKINNIN
jgi:molecular chaperone HtpG